MTHQLGYKQILSVLWCRTKDMKNGADVSGPFVMPLSLTAHNVHYVK